MCEAPNKHFVATRFGYAHNGQAVTFVHNESWCWNGVDACEVGGSYQIGYAREFRYDGARARYMNRPLDVSTLGLNPQPHQTLPTVWSDYDDDEIYGDFTVSTANPPVVSNTDAYQPGLWRKAGTASEYLHSDMLGTLRMTTGTTGTAGSSRVFTAFGERISAPTITDATRYGYVGAWGYQSTPIPESLTPDPFPYLHVGARYYDPSSGRFLQRDPIGIRGGLNVFAYVGGRPSAAADPMGLRTDPTDNEFWRQKAERDRQRREEEQRRENERLNTTPYPYEDMQDIIDWTNRTQWWLTVPATVVSVIVSPFAKIRLGNWQLEISIRQSPSCLRASVAIVRFVNLPPSSSLRASVPFSLSAFLRFAISLRGFVAPSHRRFAPPWLAYSLFAIRHSPFRVIARSRGPTERLRSY